ncbi:hypothetical protein QVD17_16868 [Tagetes erecta]|uniref:Uncharacterized protein n=1 Tax=Tagetes erecta TaxID=13708 RepID=A0AAD8P0X9_TARER|nr:hypothetical protein QVD17_16868 [Tagetes erecta]
MDRVYKGNQTLTTLSSAFSSTTPPSHLQFHFDTNPTFPLSLSVADSNPTSSTISVCIPTINGTDLQVISQHWSSNLSKTLTLPLRKP